EMLGRGAVHAGVSTNPRHPCGGPAPRSGALECDSLLPLWGGRCGVGEPAPNAAVPPAIPLRPVAAIANSGFMSPASRGYGAAEGRPPRRIGETPCRRGIFPVETSCQPMLLDRWGLRWHSATPSPLRGEVVQEGDHAQQEYGRVGHRPCASGG